MILQTASENSFITLGSSMCFKFGLVGDYDFMCTVCLRPPPGNLKHCIKGAGTQTYSISLSCVLSSTSGKSDAVSFLSKCQNAFALELRILFTTVIFEFLGLFFNSLSFSLFFFFLSILASCVTGRL